MISSRHLPLEQISDVLVPASSLKKKKKLSREIRCRHLCFILKFAFSNCLLESNFFICNSG